jgi:hypothetical protein
MLVGESDLAARVTLRLAKPHPDGLERSRELAARADEQVAKVLLIHRPAS